MTGVPSRSSWPKRIFLAVAAPIAFLLLFVIALRIIVSEIYKGIETSKATGLSAVSPFDTGSAWANRNLPVDLARVNSPWESPVARTADLGTRSYSFDHSVSELHRIRPSVLSRRSAHRNALRLWPRSRRETHGQPNMVFTGRGEYFLGNSGLVVWSNSRGSVFGEGPLRLWRA